MTIPRPSGSSRYAPVIDARPVRRIRKGFPTTIATHRLPEMVAEKIRGDFLISNPFHAASTDVLYNQMVVYELSEEQVNKVFRALADATRRDIVRRTLDAETSISVLAADYEMSFAAVQKHVAVLESAGLVTKIARGRERIVRGQPDTIRHAQELLSSLEDIWRQRISRLDNFLADEAT